ncbi:Sec-independent protein translocase protein TATB-chloroplastic [Striga hermonthica]|uniref:Sec-independent protein translocase protein TATB-chloroplastic n=1 Tax=Striga hermonthica TaxID=68872 RepID=A0A9N7N8Z3_STRHE|nr:Sec-independent protein translocase protein TATB-chloroplastic [Striga hermonthica]
MFTMNKTKSGNKRIPLHHFHVCKSSKIKLGLFVDFHMTCTMVFAVSSPSSSSFLHYSSSPSSSSSSTGRKLSPHCYFSNSATPKNAIFRQIRCFPQLGLSPFHQWSGLKLTGGTISRYSVKFGRKRNRKGKGVYASLFGVGAPEALVIGVVALLVFGPKGLAEVARNLGKTLRAFQPTIRELQEVSREFKSTLEKEIGLDDTDYRVPKNLSPDTTKPTPGDKLEDFGANTELNRSSPENSEDSAEDGLKVKADKFRGALAQLQKEQDEEKEKEKEREEEKAQSVEESESSSTVTVTAVISENEDNNASQEAASVAATAPNLESQS